jgi:hypothetical protein
MRMRRGIGRIVGVLRSYLGRGGLRRLIGGLSVGRRLSVRGLVVKGKGKEEWGDGH